MIAHIASLLAGGRPAALIAATILAVTAGGGVVEAAETFTVGGRRDRCFLNHRMQ